MSDDQVMRYIIDGNGNYYTVNASDQLVVAKDREEASVFTSFEANQRIGSGKKARFYHMIPADAAEQTEQVMLAEAKEQNRPDFEYCIEDTDWSEFINYFIFLSTGVKGYQEELAKKHSEVDKEICDLLHYIELYDLTDAEGLKAMDMLKDARQRRRDIKDEISRAEFFQKMVGTSANVAKAGGFLKEIRKLYTRKYVPRQLTDMFSGMESRLTDRKLYKEKHAVAMEDEMDHYSMDRADMEEQEMSYLETIFDHRENDWVNFAKQQMEFYQNAGQYMTNLKIEIQAIDQAIEAVMEKMETANYNVAQGYKVFKELKDLRTERKVKDNELAVLGIMTEGFDLDSMANVLSYNMDEITKITFGASDESHEQSKAV